MAPGTAEAELYDVFLEPRDWADLPDRMHYIADMFRCHGLRLDLLHPPFTAEQVEVLTDGRRPAGAL